MSGSLFKIHNYFLKTLKKFVLTLFYATCFSADATIFFKEIVFFCPQKVEKNHPQKLLRKTQIHFFFLTASSAQMAQTKEFMFQNVAYRPTVYRTGVIT